MHFLSQDSSEQDKYVFNSYTRALIQSSHDSLASFYCPVNENESLDEIGWQANNDSISVNLQ